MALIHSPQLIAKTVARSNAVMDGLTWQTKAKAKAFYKDALSNGLLLLFYSGYRDFAEQWDKRKAYLFGSGGKAAPVGDSFHNYKLALDAVPILPNGKADWNSNLWNQIGVLGEKNGLKWGGSFGDKPHFENSKGESLAKLKEENEGWGYFKDLEKSLITGVTTTTNQVAEQVNKAKKNKKRLFVWGGIALFGTAITFYVFSKKK